MTSIISISGLSKTYASGFAALKGVDLDIRRGEIFALLGPNGAGKTTLISIVCGLVNPSAGSVRVDGHDIVRDYRAARALVGLVPQELTTDAFETVWNTVSFSRGLFGKPPDPAYLEQLLKDLSLWAKKDARLMMLSGGMKRRVLIAKALSHEPRILFLDEPTAGVDVELRRDMWQLVRRLRDSGVTVILTTHYIEEAEEMADRIGVIARGELILVEGKAALMRKLGGKQLTLQLVAPLQEVPPALAHYGLTLGKGGSTLIYAYEMARGGEGSKSGEGGEGTSEGTSEGAGERAGERAIADLLQDLAAAGIAFADLHTTQRSLEEIFVSLVSEREPGGAGDPRNKDAAGTPAKEGAR